MDSSNTNMDNVDLESSDDEISITEEPVQPTGSNINIISKPTQDVVELSLNENDSGSNIDNSNEGEGSSHAI